MATNYPLNPPVQAFYKASIIIAKCVNALGDWSKPWKHHKYSFPFVWGETQKQPEKFTVVPYATDVSFFIDIPGLPDNAFGTGYAVFTSPLVSTNGREELDQTAPDDDEQGEEMGEELDEEILEEEFDEDEDDEDEFEIEEDEFNGNGSGGKLDGDDEEEDIDLAEEEENEEDIEEDEDNGDFDLDEEDEDIDLDDEDEDNDDED